MDNKRTATLIAGGILIAVILFVSVGMKAHQVDFYSRPHSNYAEVTSATPPEHKPAELEIFGQGDEPVIPTDEGAVLADAEAGHGEAAEAAVEAAEPEMVEVEGFPAVIAMNSPEYEHKKAIAQLSHQAHVDKYGYGCGDCHHDENGEPLTELKKGDEVARCIECHDKPGEPPKGRGAPDLTPEEELQFHAEAVHVNCRDCHKKYNDEHGTRDAPTSCSKCHIK